MSPSPAFGYCQARLQARYAALPAEAEWQRLGAVRTLTAFIEEARAGALRPWVAGLGAAGGAHDLERAVRARAAALAEEAAGWTPRPWRAAVAWTAWLPYLPLIEPLARGLPLPDWAGADERLRALIGSDGRPDPTTLTRAGLLPPGAARRSGTVIADWAAAWRDRWPSQRGAWARDLETLVARVAAHQDAFRHADPAAAWGLRRGLHARLHLEFHRHPLTPAACFIYLALVLLDLERLRAELLRRALFPAAAPAGPAD